MTSRAARRSTNGAHHTPSSTSANDEAPTPGGCTPSSSTRTSHTATTQRGIGSSGQNRPAAHSVPSKTPAASSASIAGRYTPPSPTSEKPSPLAARPATATARTSTTSTATRAAPTARPQPLAPETIIGLPGGSPAGAARRREPSDTSIQTPEVSHPQSIARSARPRPVTAKSS